MQQVAQIERERVITILKLVFTIYTYSVYFQDDYKNQVRTSKKQLDEAQQHQNKGDSKLTKVMQNLRILQDEKGSLEAKLGQKSVELQTQVC